MIYVLTNIMWDESTFPETMEVEAESEEDAINVAYDMTGFCIKNAVVEKKEAEPQEKPFGCPRCGGRDVEADCPSAWRVVYYDDSGEVADSETDQGTEVANERCVNCSHPFVESEWR